MKKIIGLVAMLICSLSAFAQLRVSISEITLKNGGKEKFERYDNYSTFVQEGPYINIEADIYNESSVTINPYDYFPKYTFVMEYQYKGNTYIEKCAYTNPIKTKARNELIIPPKSKLKLLLTTVHKAIPSNDYISYFIKVFPTITLKFVDDDGDNLIESSEPIKLKELTIKSDSSLAVISDTPE